MRMTFMPARSKASCVALEWQAPVSVLPLCQLPTLVSETPNLAGTSTGEVPATDLPKLSLAARGEAPDTDHYSRDVETSAQRSSEHCKHPTV